jgi:hypothetical protein
MSKARSIADHLSMTRSECIQYAKIFSKILENNTEIGVADAIEIALEYCSSENQRKFIYFMSGSFMGHQVTNEMQIQEIEKFVEFLKDNKQFGFNEDFSLN